LDEKKTDVRKKRIKLELETKRDEQRITQLTEELTKERLYLDTEESRIRNILKSKEEEKEKQKQIDFKMMMIQGQFEEWMRLVGPSKKKKAPKPKK